MRFCWSPRITQVQQRGPGHSLFLRKVDFVWSLRRGHSLSEDLVLSCRDLLSPSSPSSSEMSLLDSGSIAAVKLTGDSSRAGDSTDEDLDSGERDLDSLDSLRCLTGVLACLTGVLAFLSGTLARLRKELTVLCGVWRNLSGDLGILFGVLAGVADLLLVESCLGAGSADWSGGQAGATGTLDWSIRCWSNVHIDIKSTSVSWWISARKGKDGCWSL